MGTAVLGFGIYNSVVFLNASLQRSRHQGDASGGSLQAPGIDVVEQPGRHPDHDSRGKHGHGRPFRQLDMFGEAGATDAGGWKVCKAYKEMGLKPHKKVCVGWLVPLLPPMSLAIV